MIYSIHKEKHRIQHIGWLRAAVLGANDGIVSTASLIVGVAAAQASHNAIIIAGVAGLVAGAMSMAAGEYVSVSSQSDTEKADIEKEKKELKENYESELEELTEIYKMRGLDYALSKKVAKKLMKKDALRAHIRDELGISEINNANPIQAALSSAVAFGIGAAIPLTIVFISPLNIIPHTVSITSLILLSLLGTLAAHIGGASKLKGALRIVFWGALAMFLTASIGALFGMIL